MVPQALRPARSKTFLICGFLASFSLASLEMAGNHKQAFSDDFEKKHMLVAMMIRTKKRQKEAQRKIIIQQLEDRRNASNKYSRSETALQSQWPAYPCSCTYSEGPVRGKIKAPPSNIWQTMCWFRNNIQSYRSCSPPHWEPLAFTHPRTLDLGWATSISEVRVSPGEEKTTKYS